MCNMNGLQFELCICSLSSLVTDSLWQALTCRLPVDEDELPEMLREAIQKARHRAAQDASSDSDESGEFF